MRTACKEDDVFFRQLLPAKLEVQIISGDRLDRYSAVFAASALRLPAALSIALADADEKIHTFAAKTLCSLGAAAATALPAIQELLATGKAVRKQALATLREMGNDAAPAVAHLIRLRAELLDEGARWEGGDDSKHIDAAEEILFSLKRCSPNYTSELSKLLLDSNEDIAWGALRVLGNFGRTALEAATPQLVGLLRKLSFGKSRLHYSDIDLDLEPILKELGNSLEPFVHDIAECLDDPECGWIAADALAALGKKAVTVVPCAASLLKHENAEVVESAIKVLCYVGEVGEVGESALPVALGLREVLARCAKDHSQHWCKYQRHRICDMAFKLLSNLGSVAAVAASAGVARLMSDSYLLYHDFFSQSLLVASSMFLRGSVLAAVGTAAADAVATTVAAASTSLGLLMPFLLPLLLVPLLLLRKETNKSSSSSSSSSSGAAVKT